MDDNDKEAALRNYLALYNAIALYDTVRGMRLNCGFCGRPGAHPNCVKLANTDTGARL